MGLGIKGTAMDFELNDEQTMIQDLAVKFGRKEIQPRAREYDQEEKYPVEVVKMACRAGLVGAVIPREYGGPGLGFVEQALISEQLSRFDLAQAQAIEAASFGAIGVLLFGNDRQKRKFLPPVVSGEAVSAGAFTEPDAGTDLAAVRTKAVRQGRELVISGAKMFITNGTVCDYLVVLCRTDQDRSRPHEGLSLILVEADRPGVSARKISGKMGLRASDTAEVAFEEVRVPAENVLGREGRAFKQMMTFFDCTRTMVAAQAVGLAQGALDLALAYTAQRTTFGRPLAANQAIGFQLAEMATHIEAARSLAYRAAWLVDQGRTDPKLVAMAKWLAAETAVRVCDRSLQMHGGYGYIDEYDIQRYYRDAKVLEIYEGAKEAEKMSIAKRLIPSCS